MGAAKNYRGFSKERLHELLREMMLIRVFEDKAGFAYRVRKIGGFCHLVAGQEAVPVGCVAALDLQRDYVLTSYRDHGHAISCGINPKNVMAELYGKVTGCSRGKGGSMHMFNVKTGFLGGNGIVGAQIPIATGAAFTQKYKKNGGVTLCFFGDGALQQGAFHESVNLAKLWGLPCIYVIENNKYGMGTAVSRASSLKDFSKAGMAYGVEGRVVDGMNFFSVYEAFTEMIKKTRKENQPLIVDVETYRYYGHSMSDPAKYRTKEELEAFKQKDPIEQMKKELLDNKLITSSEIEAMHQSVEAQVLEAEKFADESPEPELHTMYEDIMV